MANEMTRVFQNDQFGEIRTVLKDGEPWFVAADVCRALELDQVTNALRRLDDDEKALITIKGISRGNDQATVINEPGLYSLTLSSRKPEAKTFKRWITHEVIPDIRRYGMYATPEAVESWIGNPDVLITVLTKYKEEKEKCAKLQQANDRLEAENELLAIQHATWDDRGILNSLIPAVAGKWGKGIGEVWNVLYREAKRKYHFDLVARHEFYKGKKKRSVLDFATEDEMTKLLMCAGAAAYFHEVNIYDLLNPVNAKRVEELRQMDAEWEGVS